MTEPTINNRTDTCVKCGETGFAPDRPNCTKCGTPLTNTCTSCQAAVAVGDNYCTCGGISTFGQVRERQAKARPIKPGFRW